jgi:CRP-like cAMP-binding protein
MSLLRELPMFKWATMPKVANIAYYMTSQNFSPRSVVVKAGQPIQYVILITSGLVKVAQPQEDAKETASLGLSVRELGRGQIIGQREIFKGLLHFDATYVTSTTTDVFQIPLSHFQVCV